MRLDKVVDVDAVRSAQFVGGGILAQLARYGSTLFRNCYSPLYNLGARHVSYNKTTEIERDIDKERDAAC